MTPLANNLRLALLLGAAWSAAACERCDGCQRPTLPAPASELRATPAGLLHVKAPGRDTLTLPVQSATMLPGQLQVRAAGPRTGWLYQLDVVIAVQGEGPKLRGVGEGGRCDARYLQEGRATVAELAPEEVSLRPVSPEAKAFAVSWRCRKRFDERTDGKPYAAPLPDTFEVAGTITTER